ncbi:DUF7282 domain-containing protein [Halogranum amylolyticum]|nr:hypothetical protein [Halogranum amylolyticum]
MDSHTAPGIPSRRQALKLFGSGLAAVGLGATTGLAESDTESTTESEATAESETESTTESEATVTLEDQSPHYRTVTVATVTLPDDGFVAVHDASFFTEGPVLGVSAPLSAGEYHKLPIVLDELPDGPLTVAAIPHEDTPSDGVFSYPEDGDAPYVGEGGVVHDYATLQPE